MSEGRPRSLAAALVVERKARSLAFPRWAIASVPRFKVAVCEDTRVQSRLARLASSVAE